MLYDSFIHRLSSSNEVIKQIDYRDLIPNESTLLKLKKAYNYLAKIENELLNPRREQINPIRVTSYIRMMEEEARLIERTRQAASAPGAAAGDEIDVVGIDEGDYHHHHHMDLHEVVEEEEVGYYQEDLELEQELQEHVEEDYLPVEDELVEEEQLVEEEALPAE